MKCHQFFRARKLMSLIMSPNYSRQSVKLINTPVPLPLHVAESGSHEMWTNPATRNCGLIRQPEAVD